MPDDVVFSEFGSTGLSRWGGSVQEEFLVELQSSQGRQLYREMRWNDPIVNAVFFGIEHSLRQVRFYAKPASDKPEDKAKARYLEQAIHDMSFSWDDEMLFILHMLEQGVSILELVYKKRLGNNPPKYIEDPGSSEYNDGKIGWRKWAPRPVDTLTPGDEWIFDGNGAVQGVNQTAPPDYIHTPIPIKKLLMFRTTPAPYNNPEGRPITRGMFTSYYYATQLREIEAIGIERNLVGVPLAYMGRDCTFQGEKSDWERLKRALRRLRKDEQETLLIPKHKMKEGDNTGILIELMAPARGQASKTDIGPVISRYEKRMALAVLAQFVMLGLENVGSYALARAQKDFFSMAVGAWANQIAEVVNRFAVPRLFALNSFPGGDGLPQWTPSEVGVPDLEALASFVNKLVGAGVLTPDDRLEAAMRAFGRLPQKVEEIEDGKREQKAIMPMEDEQDIREFLGILEELGVTGLEVS